MLAWEARLAMQGCSVAAIAASVDELTRDRSASVVGGVENELN